MKAQKKKLLRRLEELAEELTTLEVLDLDGCLRIVEEMNYILFKLDHLK